MKFRTWMNILTVILLGLAVYLGRNQIIQAWGLVGRVNLWIFALIIPIQLFSYYAVGQVMFSYLRAKGNLETMSRWNMARVALELNFVNHIIPVPTFAGFSYLGWILSHYGVGAGRATMAQIIRFATMFISFIIMILLSVVVLIFDRGVDRTIIVISAALMVATVVSTVVLIYVLNNRQRLMLISLWLVRFVNKLVYILTLGKKKETLIHRKVEKFFGELHQDYMEIKDDKQILKKPMKWAIVSNVLDVSLIAVAFLALGFWVNPATLFIAYGLASFTAIFAATPGGSGVYEAIMIAFLVSAGVPAGVAIAGTLLARVTLFAGTIIFGYLFYQLSINKYGKINTTTNL